MKIRTTVSALITLDTVLVSIDDTNTDLLKVLPDGKLEISIKIEDRKKIDLRKLMTLARKMISLAKKSSLKKLAVKLDDWKFSNVVLNESELIEMLVINWEMAGFEFNQYKEKPAGGWSEIEEVIIIGTNNKTSEQAIKRGQIIASEVNSSRVLANTPGGEMTPQSLAEAAIKSAKNTPINVEILGLKNMKELKMGAILGVSQGSDEEPKFIIMEYWGSKRSEPPVVLIGKGVTFDTGGLNLKPSDGLKDMYLDMSGGASVIHTVVLSAKLGLKKNVIGLVPAAENMVSGSSYRPGDILKTMSGKTVEIGNTDAEGRLLLADALTYAQKYKPKLVVDVATLTGAALVALGERASAIFTKDEKLEKLFRELGELSGDFVWPLPLWNEFIEEMKGTFADLNNVSKSRYGGAITAAIFLYQFTNDFPWVHMDIAPRMTSVDGEFLAKGSVGTPVRLLIKLLETY